MSQGEASLPKPKIAGFCLIRDAEGKIKADGDANRWPDEIKRQLTPQERQQLGVKGYD